VRAALGLAVVRRDVLVAWWQERLAAATIFVATPAGDIGSSCEPIGFVEVVPGELHALYVVPEHWGTGAAAALHRRALATLGDPATLIVMRDNIRARRFYERNGWQLVGDDAPHDFDGVLVPFVRYRR
jgi:RimJ/RimL family protein N-acetyltransferase